MGAAVLGGRPRLLFVLMTSNNQDAVRKRGLNSEGNRLERGHVVDSQGSQVTAPHSGDRSRGPQTQPRTYYLKIRAFGREREGNEVVAYTLEKETRKEPKRKGRKWVSSGQTVGLREAVMMALDRMK